MDKERRKQLKRRVEKESLELQARLEKENPYELSDPRWGQTMLAKYQEARAQRRGETAATGVDRITQSHATDLGNDAKSHLPISATVPQIISFVDAWVACLEREDYGSAYAFTEHNPDMGWSPELVREVIKAYGNSAPTQKATLDGAATDRVQRKEVHHFVEARDGYLGYVWYDLNIDGRLSDLTATFDIRSTSNGLVLVLEDIHVM
jgi:hypothetical protein